MWAFEGLVRDILRTALVTIPSDPMERMTFLDSLASTTDAERINKIRHAARDLQDMKVREAILASLPKA